MFILALDGGGIRGAYSTRLLQRLELSFPTLITGADLVAGTSTGGIIALGLAAGIEPSDILNFYLQKASVIFGHDATHEALSLGELKGPKYDNAGLQKSLREILGDKKLSDLNRDVLVTTYELSAQAARDDASIRTDAPLRRGGVAHFGGTGLLPAVPGIYRRWDGGKRPGASCGRVGGCSRPSSGRDIVFFDRHGQCQSPASEAGQLGRPAVDYRGRFYRSCVRGAG